MIVFIMRGVSHSFVPPLFEEIEFSGIIDFVGLKTVHDVMIHQSAIDAHCHEHHFPAGLASRNAVFRVER